MKITDINVRDPFVLTLPEENRYLLLHWREKSVVPRSWLLTSRKVLTNPDPMDR